MSVLGCSKCGCHNIKCDTLVDMVGWVCDECQTDFALDMLDEVKTKPSKQEITAALEAWLQIEKEEHISRETFREIEQYFKEFKNY